MSIRDADRDGTEWPEERYSPRQRWFAGALVLFFLLAALVTTVLSLGAYCLTTDGADTRALSEAIRSFLR